MSTILHVAGEDCAQHHAVLRHLHIEPQPLFSLAVLMSSSVQSNGYNMASLVQLTTKCSDDVTAEMSFGIADNRL